MLHQVGRPLQNASDIAEQIVGLAGQRLAAFDGVGVKCFAFDSMVLDLCRLEGDTSCLMS